MTATTPALSLRRFASAFVFVCLGFGAAIGRAQLPSGATIAPPVVNRYEKENADLQKKLSEAKTEAANAKGNADKAEVARDAAVREAAKIKAEAEAQKKRADEAVQKAVEASKAKPPPPPPPPRAPTVSVADLQAAQREAQQERARREQAERNAAEANERARLAKEELDEANKRIAQLVGQIAKLQAQRPPSAPVASAPVAPVAAAVTPAPPAPPAATAATPISRGQIDKPCADCPELVIIAPGNFVMGSPASEKGYADEQPQRTINIRYSFAVGKYEVTQAEWRAIMGNNPSHFQKCGDRCPVENVRWNDIQQFLTRLNSKTGRQYRLLTEAEWEFVARAGSSAAYSFGGSEAQLGNYAWFGGNSGSSTHPVGEKLPNAWGIHDMHGNVWEWVQDCFVNPYPKTPVDGSAVQEYANCNRVLRGGSWNNDAHILRSAYRVYVTPDIRNFIYGFRIARTLF